MLVLGVRTLKERMPGVVLRILAMCLHVKTRWTREVTVRLLMIERRISDGRVVSRLQELMSKELLRSAKSTCRQPGAK